MQEVLENCILNENEIEKIRRYLPNRTDVASIERVFSALGDKTRIRILSALSITPMCVSEIVEVLQINQTTVSHQLAFLRSCGMVEDERRGKNVTYALKNKALLPLFSCVLDFIEEDCAKVEDFAVDF